MDETHNPAGPAPYPPLRELLSESERAELALAFSLFGAAVDFS